MSTASSNQTYYSNLKSQTTSECGKSYRTLQLILEEKNKVIERLKKQVHNQRIQLKFYIKKEMNSPLMVDFAKTCLPELTDENMTLTLAINKFYKEMGLKSRMIDIYDRVCNIAGRTTNIIQGQESLLGEIIENLRQYMNPKELKSFLGNFDINTNFIEVFNSLLESTLSLKRSMGTFRGTCDKLIATEEKRNAIVEQVYSLPQEERTICNYLINIQMEKFELEHIIKQIAVRQKSKDSCLDEIDIIENNLKILHQNINGINDENDMCVTAMLEKVYAQAMALLTLSRQQRQKYTKEIEQLKAENDELRQLIQHIDEQKPMTTRTRSADFKDIEKLHSVIKRTISEAQKFEKVKSEELKKKSRECEKLKLQLDRVQKKQIENFLQTDQSDSSATPVLPMSKSELSSPVSYKDQVETLQNIRDAYTASKK